MKETPVQDNGERPLKVALGVLAVAELLGFLAGIAYWLLRQ